MYGNNLVQRIFFINLFYYVELNNDIFFFEYFMCILVLFFDEGFKF